MRPGYTDPRGIYYPPSQPYHAYGPGTTVRFFRSQNSWNGEGELNERYRSSQQIAAWAAARPFPNMLPFVKGPHVQYNLPDGPANPSDLLWQRAVPPNFPAGDYRTYLPDRYSPGVLAVPPAGAAPSAPYTRDGAFRETGNAPPQHVAMGRMGVGAADCPCPPSVDLMASAFAIGLKRIMPELAKAIGVETGQRTVDQYNGIPAQVEPPVRSWAFNEATPAPITINDPLNFSSIVTHRVPRGTMAVAKWLLVSAESAAALDDVEWRITVGGNPQIGFTSLNQPDLASGDPAPITVKAIEDQLIRLQARVRTAGNTHAVRGILRGWDFTPSRMTNLEAIDGWRGR